MCVGEAYWLQTFGRESESNGWFYVIGSTFQFQLQTCSSAQITLATNPRENDTDGYRINIRSRSSITRIISDETVSRDTPDLLSCTDARTFWLKWSDGIVRLGHGKLNTNQLIEFQDSSQLFIVAAELSTVDEDGVWRVAKSQGELAINLS